jgi:hypothetical protein
MSKHYVYKIVADDEPENPRDDDNLGAMYCAHRRYSLGDHQVAGDGIALKIELVEKYEPGFTDRLEFKFGTWFPNKEDQREQDRLRLAYIDRHFDEHYLSLNLYLYDHSGLRMNTCGFSCPWDSGQVGIIAIAKEKVRQEYGWKKLTKARQAKILEYLDNEVKEYDQYLSGDVHGFILYEVPDHIIEEYLDDPEYDLQEVVEFLDLSECEEVESLYGFYSKEECEAQAKDCLKTWEETYYARVAREAGQLDLPLAA